MIKWLNKILPRKHYFVSFKVKGLVGSCIQDAPMLGSYSIVSSLRSICEQEGEKAIVTGFFRISKRAADEYLEYTKNNCLTSP